MNETFFYIFLILLPPAVIGGTYLISKNPPPANPETEGPSGVGGWLLILTSGLIFLGPFVGALNLNGELVGAESQFPNLLISETWKEYKSSIWLFYLVMSVVSIYAGYGLSKRRTPSTVKNTKILLWFLGPVAISCMYLFIPLATFGEIASYGQVVFLVAISCITPTIWSFYLSKSRRVKATYYPPKAKNA